MSSAIDICNLALSHIGQGVEVVSIDPADGSTEAGYCKRFYPMARQEALEAGDWSFSLKRLRLAQVANPSTVWTYAYQLPSDCLRARRVLRSSAFLGIWGFGVADGYAAIDRTINEQGSAQFEIESGVLLTHEPEAVLLYVRDVTDTTEFTPGFVMSLGMMMAAYLAGPLIKGSEGMRVGDAWRQRATEAAGRAAALDANASHETAQFIPGGIAARQ